jgi:lysylphosphatidylglycerol synthetase-like protein (DUF2156 family)
MDKLWPRRRWIIPWQLAFLLLGTTWLMAPFLNHALSYRVSLISQYESPAQPFSWLFRLGDVLAALLLIWLAGLIKRQRINRTSAYLLLLIGAGMLIDPLFATSCSMHGSVCEEYVTPTSVVHGAETVVTGLSVFLLAVHDIWRRRRLVSIGFVAFQLIYGVLFLSQLADQDNFNTLSQYLYQLAVIVWLAWLGRDLLLNGPAYRPVGRRYNLIKLGVATWGFLNGLLAILVSLRHLNLINHLKGLYFAGNNAWLAQHGVAVGVVMVYLSWHLARGELRARQIFLLITGLETLKYAVITPNLPLLLIYSITFCGLFVLRDVFDRGVVPVTVSQRLREALFVVGSLLLAAFLALLLLSRTPRLSRITAGSIDHFFDYTIGSRILPHGQIKSALLAHTISAFILTGGAVILWILFRPYKYYPLMRRNDRAVKDLLKKYSASSEDYFKLWPSDKDYFWAPDGEGFIAYKAVGSIVFALAGPVCHPDRQAELLKSFMAWARSHRWRVCFLPVNESDIGLYKSAGLNNLQIGSSALIKILNFLEDTTKGKWWRWQKNRAAKDGYEYQLSQPPHDPGLMRQLKQVSDAWLSHNRQERGFALGYFDADYLAECDIHYLQTPDKKVVAFTNQLPVFNNGDTASIDLLRHLPADGNVMASLLLSTIQTLKSEYEYFDLGFVPFAAANNPVIAVAKVLSAGRFSAKGLEQFKNKFDPIWQANYMAYDGDLSDLALIAANLEKAMSAGL